jgi:hypothetical protein
MKGVIRMGRLSKMINIFRGILSGLAVVIVKHNEQNAKVYCGKNVSKDFVVRSFGQ